MKCIGEIIILRDWEAQDIESYSHWVQPHHDWHDLDGPYYKITNEEALKKIETLRKKIELGEFANPRNRLVIADPTDNKLVGTVSCYWESKETNWLCAGITIFDPAAWKKGIGFEALGLWIEYLFANYKDIVRLDLRTWSGNLGMIKLTGKLGFLREACFRNARIVNGKYYDSLGFGILKPEWQKKYPFGFLAEIQQGKAVLPSVK